MGRWQTQADAHAQVRRAAVDRVKTALDMGARFSVLWPATDGNDFPLQSDYAALYARYVESVRELLDYRRAQGYATRLCIEPKPFEPRTHIMMGSTAQALCLVNEINDPGLGLNVDIGHSLIAGENLEDQLAPVLRYGKLCHTHFNDNDQQCDADLPPGTVSFTRPIAVMYVLDEAGYDGWYGLHLFPYRDTPRTFVELSRDNLCFAQSVVEEMNAKGARELRSSGRYGPELAALIRDCIRAVRQ